MTIPGKIRWMGSIITASKHHMATKTKAPAKKKKNPMKGKKNPNAGRRFFDCKTPAQEQKVLSELTFAWSVGASDVEACAYANISVPALHRYFEKHPEFREERDRQKRLLILEARQRVAEKIKSKEAGLSTSMWFLERKMKDEFSTKHFSSSEVVQGEMSEERKQKVMSIFDSFGIPVENEQHEEQAAA